METAAAAAAAFLLAVHFGHDLTHGETAREGVTVLPIGGDHGVLRRQGLHDTDRICFFAYIEVQKTADLFLRVELRTFLFETADTQHFSQEIQGMFAA